MVLAGLPQRRSLVAACASVVLAVGLAACGSSNSSSNSSTSSSSASSSGTSGSGASSSSASSSGSSNSTLSALQAIVQAHTKDPTSIGISTPITKPIPKGKSIIYVNCGAPACTQMGESLAQAAQVLGWTVSDIVATPTPAGIQAAFSEAIEKHPNAVVSDGFPAVAYEHQIAQLHAMHAFVVSNNGPDNTGQNGIDLQTGLTAMNDAGNQLLADKVLIDDGLKGDIGEVFLTGYPIVADYAQAFVNQVKAKCPSCTITKLVLAPTDIGTTAAGKIADFLRINPNIKQVYLTYDALALGLPAALKGAGVAQPELYSWAVDNSGLEALEAGQRTAVVPECYPEVGWRWADGLARLFTGTSTAPDETFESFPIWAEAYHNVPTNLNNPPCDPNYQSQFKALWH
jgi:ABC-type sugar transport system substrate-binding protein